MKNIKTIIQEKLTINKNSEVVHSPKANVLVVEVQNEYDDNCAYQSFVYDKGKNKYEYGFFIFNKDDEFFSITAFNDDEESKEYIEESLGIDTEQLLGLEVGTMTSSKPNFRITRIW